MDFRGRLEHRERIGEMLDGVLSGQTTAHWLEVFAGRIPAAPVNPLQDALENPFVKDERRLQELELEGF